MHVLYFGGAGMAEESPGKFVLPLVTVLRAFSSSALQCFIAVINALASRQQRVAKQRCQKWSSTNGMLALHRCQHLPSSDLAVRSASAAFALAAFALAVSALRACTLRIDLADDSAGVHPTVSPNVQRLRQACDSPCTSGCRCWHLQGAAVGIEPLASASGASRPVVVATRRLHYRPSPNIVHVAFARCRSGMHHTSGASSVASA